MRDRERIDAELRLIASMREHGGEPSSRQIDELLDERLGHRAKASRPSPVTSARFSTTSGRRTDEIDGFAPHRRTGVLRRFGPLAALPLSLVAVVIAFVVIFADHNPRQAAQPTVVPPSVVPPSVVPPSGERPSPAVPKTAAPLGIVDRALVEALKQNGVPIPSQEYVMSRGHAVCDFLADRPNLAEAVAFVQRTSVWDANQSADFAAGAIVSYCPQYGSASPTEMQQPFQDALSDLQAIQGDLQGIRDGIDGIRDHLPLPGQ
jgi:hypothetical protein